MALRYGMATCPARCSIFQGQSWRHVPAHSSLKGKSVSQHVKIYLMITLYRLRWRQWKVYASLWARFLRYNPQKSCLGHPAPRQCSPVWQVSIMTNTPLIDSAISCPFLRRLENRRWRQSGLMWAFQALATGFEPMDINCVPCLAALVLWWCTCWIVSN